MPIARTLFNQSIPMRDGIALAADVALPPGDGPFPTVLTRTPYMRGANLMHPAGWSKLCDSGYAWIGVDMRGRGDSEGDFSPFEKDPDDAYDTVEWIAAQPWCSGRIGMAGFSYEGVSQWWTAMSGAPHLSCIAPMGVGAAREGTPYEYAGVPVQYYAQWFHLATGRTRPNIGAPSWDDGMRHLPMRTLAQRLGTGQRWWSRYVDGEIDILSEDFALTPADWAALDVPALVVAGWWDDQTTMDAWQAVKDSPGGAGARLLIGAWDHVGNQMPRRELGGVDVSASMLDVHAYLERFFAAWLKEDAHALDGVPRCRVFRTGAMRWEALDDWPDPGAQLRPWWLSSGGPANGMSGDGRLVPGDVAPAEGEPADTYVYDPADPGADLYSVSGFAWSDPPLDRSYLHRRADRLNYASEPLEAPLHVSGQPILELSFSSDRTDTDVYAELVDVAPNGTSIALMGVYGPGLQRLRFRNGPEEELLTPGEVVPVRFPLAWVHHTFLPGHRIRVVVSSSGYPICARNLNTGGFWADEVEPLVARNSVHHSALHPSRLLLPVQTGVPA